MNRIPGGMLDNSTEFFTVFNPNSQRAGISFGGHVYDFDNAPECRILMLEAKYHLLDKRKRDMYSQLSRENNISNIEQMTMCMYGAINTDPDIDENGNFSDPEYVPCLKRGSCPFEGEGCSNIMADNGMLSKAETQVFRLVNLPDKEIADRLFISTETVKKHFQNIRLKTGFANKIEMAVWATKKGII